MFGLERLPEERIVSQVNHSDAEIIAGAPIRIDQFDLFRRKISRHLLPRVSKLSLTKAAQVPTAFNVRSDSAAAT